MIQSAPGSPQLLRQAPDGERVDALRKYAEQSGKSGESGVCGRRVVEEW